MSDIKALAETKIKAVARNSILVSFAAILLLIAGYIIYPAYLFSLDSPQINQYFHTYVIPDGLKIDPIPFGRMLAAFFLIITKMFAIYAFYRAIRLFQSCRDGHFLSAVSAGHIQVIGWLLIFIPYGTMFSRPLAALALTNGQSLNTFIESLHYGWGTFLATVIGILLVVVGKVFVEAVTISEENKSYI